MLERRAEAVDVKVARIAVVPHDTQQAVVDNVDAADHGAIAEEPDFCVVDERAALPTSGSQFHLAVQ